jgi:hypothetical protein
VRHSADIPGEANLLADAGRDITADLGGDRMIWREVFGKIPQSVSSVSECCGDDHTDSFQSMGTPVQ